MSKRFKRIKTWHLSCVCVAFLFFMFVCWFPDSDYSCHVSLDSGETRYYGETQSTGSCLLIQIRASDTDYTAQAVGCWVHTGALQQLQVGRLLGAPEQQSPHVFTGANGCET